MYVLLAVIVALMLLLFGGFSFFLFDYLEKLLGYADYIAWLLEGEPEDEHEH